jgi:hypothetical protein
MRIILLHTNHLRARANSINLKVTKDLMMLYKNTQNKEKILIYKGAKLSSNLK